MMVFLLLQNTMLTLTLFTTSHCHLCEQAIELITKINLTKPLVLVEIANDDNLLMQYGERIPVLQRSDNCSELNWPFTRDDLVAFINP
jgi:hypothetical protein